MSQKSFIEILEDGTAYYHPSSNEEGSKKNGRLIETKRVKAEALIPELGELLIVPANCRYMRHEEGTTVFVLEEEPQSSRTVRWITENEIYRPMKQRLMQSGFYHLIGQQAADFQKRLEVQQLFHLAFPYLVKCYVFKGNVFQSVSLWYRREPVRSLEDQLLYPNLPNVDPKDDVTNLCLTPTAKNMRGKPFAEMMREIEAEFWGSAWQQELTNHFFAEANRLNEVASPWEWERASAIDALFALKLNWRKSPWTIGELIRSHFAEKEKQENIFTFFVNRVNSADSWDFQPAVTDFAMEVSPSESVNVWVHKETIELYLHDVIEIAHASNPALQSGQTYEIEWFAKADAQGNRFVKLVGVSEPQMIIVKNTLIDGCTRVVSVAKPVVVMGCEMRAGMMLRFTDTTNWYDRHATKKYVIEQMRLQGNMLTVKFALENCFTVVAMDGVWCPGVEVICDKPEKVEEKTKITSITLNCGTVVRIGDRVFDQDNYDEGCEDEQCIFVVKDFVKVLLDVGEDEFQNYECTILDQNGDDNNLVDVEGNFWNETAIFPSEPIKSIEIDGQMLKIGQSIRLDGEKRKILAFSPLVSGNRYAKLENFGWLFFGWNNELDDELTGRIVLPRKRRRATQP